MARPYPRFLLSHVTEGKSTGYFIVHLLKPRCLFKFEWPENGEEFGLTMLISFEEDPDYFLVNDVNLFIKDARSWVIAQIAAGRITR